MMRADAGTVQKRLLKWLKSRQEADSEKKGNANRKGMKWGMKWGHEWWIGGGWWGRPARARPIFEARQNDKREKKGKKERLKLEKRVVKMTERRKMPCCLYPSCLVLVVTQAVWMMDIWIRDCLLVEGKKKKLPKRQKLNSVSIVTRKECIHR